jgi:hypothetical protein
LDALRLTRFQREAAVSGLGSSKKETVLWLRRAKSSACHLHRLMRDKKKGNSQLELKLPPKPKPQLELIWTPVTINKNQIRLFCWDTKTDKKGGSFFMEQQHIKNKRGNFAVTRNKVFFSKKGTALLLPHQIKRQEIVEAGVSFPRDEGSEKEEEYQSSSTTTAESASFRRVR